MLSTGQQNKKKKIRNMYISHEVDSMIDESLFTETKQKICYTGNSLQTGETENFVDCM